MLLPVGDNILVNRTMCIIPGFTPFVNPFLLDILARYLGLWQTIFEVQQFTGALLVAPTGPRPPLWHSAARSERG